MKKIIILVVVVAAAYAGVQVFKMKDKETFTNHSKLRVEKMLYGIQSGKTALEQESIGCWYNGRPSTTVTEPMADSFDDFKREKGIYSVSSYEVLSATLFGGESQVERFVEVRFKADGKELGVIVMHGKTMKWMD